MVLADACESHSIPKGSRPPCWEPSLWSFPLWLLSIAVMTMSPTPTIASFPEINPLFLLYFITFASLLALLLPFCKEDQRHLHLISIHLSMFSLCARSHASKGEQPPHKKSFGVSVSLWMWISVTYPVIDLYFIGTVTLEMFLLDN